MLRTSTKVPRDADARDWREVSTDDVTLVIDQTIPELRLWRVKLACGSAMSPERLSPCSVGASIVRACASVPRRSSYDPLRPSWRDGRASLSGFGPGAVASPSDDHPDLRLLDTLGLNSFLG